MRLSLRALPPVIACCAVLGALPSFAIPIKPDLKKVLVQPAQRTPAYIPASARRNGPEQKSPEDRTYVQSDGPRATARAVRASLIAAAVPDWRTIVGLVMLIFLLRRLRKESTDDNHTSDQGSSAKMPRTA